MLNDVIDWVNGVDQGNYFRIQYGGHIMELMNRKETATYQNHFYFILLCFVNFIFCFILFYFVLFFCFVFVYFFFCLFLIFVPTC